MAIVSPAECSFLPGLKGFITSPKKILICSFGGKGIAIRSITSGMIVNFAEFSLFSHFESSSKASSYNV